MNKILTIITLVAGLAVGSFAGESCFQKNDNIVQAGLGLGMGDEGFPVGFAATYERGIHDFISVGGSMGFSAWKLDFVTGHYTVVGIPISFRGAFHPFKLPVLEDKVSIKDKLDVYGGLAMGWSIWRTKWHSENSELNEFLGDLDHSVDNGKLLFSFLLGARYYFNDRFGVYLEESANSTGIFNLGATLKF